MDHRASHYANEHPLDVLTFVAERLKAGTPCALAMLTSTRGGAVRAPGALMAVTQTGQICGYLSGGCIDADVALHAKAALDTGTIKTLHYGKGSPFIDIALPCGGAITLDILPNPDMVRIDAAIDKLANRAPSTLHLNPALGSYIAHYTPKLRLRIAGRSADPLALARISMATGISTALWSSDTACLKAAKSITGLETTTLTSPAELPSSHDDTATAFVLMMHDHDWEPALLKQALAGPAFYIGAVGSPHTHTKRKRLLASQGVSSADIARIHAPIGLVPSLRDASMLAISTLAEIIAAFSQEDTVQNQTSRRLTHA